MRLNVVATVLHLLCVHTIWPASVLRPKRASNYTDLTSAACVWGGLEANHCYVLHAVKSSLSLQ